MIKKQKNKTKSPKKKKEKGVIYSEKKITQNVIRGGVGRVSHTY